MLRDFHRRRLADAASEFDRFAERAQPGIYGLGMIEGRFVVEPRGATRLVDGMPTRLMPSPVLDAAGPVPKPPPDGKYRAVRAVGICTLLHGGNGELLEACSAALLSWAEERIVLVPSDRPRVDSVSEAAIRRHLPFIERSLAMTDAAPLAVVNAVAGVVSVFAPGRAPMPSRAAEQVRALWAGLTSRA